MHNRRKFIKNVIRLTFRTILGAFVFYISVYSVPTLQAFWENSGILDVASGNLAGSKFHNQKYAVIGEAVLDLEIAKTPEERQQGLSGRASLPNNTGLLFIFDKVDYHGIWMKDMNFAIDIVWIDETMKIIAIEENVSPDTFPIVYKPERKANYVLEVPAGYVKLNGIKITDWVDIL